MALGNSRRDVTVRMRGEVGQYVASQRLASAATRSTARDLEQLDVRLSKSGNGINVLTGRLAAYRDGAIALGPAAVPITSVMVPALTALATQGLAAASAAGVAVTAFLGMGDAFKALDKARIDPTAENLKAAQLAMAELAPDAQEFVLRARELAPALRDLRAASAEGLFGGGLTESLDSVEKLLPMAERIALALGGELGDIAADGAASLASDEWEEFFTFLETEGPQALRQLADATGNLGRFIANTLMAFDPASDNFADGLVKKTGQLADAAERMDETQGFQDFLAYTREVGPQVLDTLGATANALVQLGQAAAPLGGPVLQGLEALLDAFAAIADSPLGTPLLGGLAALTLYNRGLQLSRSVLGQASTEQKGYVAAAVDGWRRQVASIREVPTALRDVRTASGLVAAEQSKLNKATGQYNAVLQLRNRGFGATAAVQARVTDSLDRLRLAEFGVAEATDRSRNAQARRTAVLRDAAAGATKSVAVASALAIAGSGAADSIGLTNTVTLGLLGTMGGPFGVAVGAGVGLLRDYAATSDGAADALTRLENALDSGNADELASSLALARKELEDIGSADSTLDALGDGFRGFFTELGRGDFGFFEDLQEKASQADAELDRIGSRDVGAILTQGLGAGAQAAAADLEYLTQGLVEYQAALTKLSGEYTLDQGLIATREAIRGIATVVEDNPLGKNFADGLGDAGRQGDALREALLKAGQQAIDTASLMEDADSREYLKNTRRQIIDTARDLGLPIPKVRELLGSLGLLDEAQVDVDVAAPGAVKVITDLDTVKTLTEKLPPEVSTRVVAEGIPTSVRGMRQLIDQLDLLPNDVRTLVQASGAKFTEQQLQNLLDLALKLNGQKARPSVKLTGVGAVLAAAAQIGAALDFAARPRVAAITATRNFFSGLPGGADGGRVVPAMDGGGTVPGQRTPYGDKVYIFAAPGEEVISNRYGQADQFRADRAAGRIPAYADGGTVGPQRLAAGGSVRANAGGISIVFPDPVVSRAVLLDAQGIAVAAALSARSSRDSEKAGLSILQQQQRINQINGQLAETERYGKGKGKKRKTRLAVRGFDRDVLTAELAEEQRALVDLQNRQDEVDAAIEKFNDEQATREAERTTLAETFYKASSASRAPATGSLSQTLRDTADLQRFGSIMGQLQGKASPALLRQVLERAEGGDFRGAIRFGQALLTQPVLLGQFNAALDQRASVAGTLASAFSNPAFFSGSPFAGAQQLVTQRVESTVYVQPDPSSWMATLRAQITHDVTQNVLAST